MEKFSEYDTYMKSLTDEKYTKVKEIWNNIVPEINTLYNKIKTSEPKQMIQAMILIQKSSMN